MESSSAELPDPSSTLEREVLASLALDRVAEELGAIAAAVLLTEGPRVELTHFWSRSGADGTHRSFEAHQNLAQALESSSGQASWLSRCSSRDELVRLRERGEVCGSGFRSLGLPEFASWLPCLPPQGDYWRNSRFPIRICLSQ
jgi:hypothetical protein